MRQDSSAPMSRPVSASSRVRESLPTFFGNRCRVPTSATMPTCTSRMLKMASAEHNLTSAAADKSTPPPMHAPCTTQITGFRHSSMAVKHACKYFTCAMNRIPLRAASSSSASPAIGAFTSGSLRSRPAVNPFPRADKTMHRQLESLDSPSKTVLISRHISMFIAFMCLGRFNSTCITPASPTFDTTNAFKLSMATSTRIAGCATFLQT
mmetsp:Transcript_21424/g.52005  ORF Transcript_21424/g.52005 Transcript_21424/m.52005 type:complete len:209 (+) Transcript_21424:508-1134(+)